MKKFTVWDVLVGVAILLVFLAGIWAGAGLAHYTQILSWMW